MAYPYYNNYYPYYAPMQQPVQPMQNPQPVQAPVQQNPMPVSQPTNPSSIIWVRNQNEAMLYPVAPNNAVALWDENSAAVYLKQADASGKPTMKTFDLVERTETPSDGSKPESGNNVPYATKEDVAALASVVKGFDSMIASMRGDIEKMSGDLYGLAGSKKKPTKKVESEEES